MFANISISAGGLLMSSNRDMALEGTKLLVQRDLSLVSQGDILLRSIENDQAIGNGLMKKVYGDVSMVADTLLMSSEEKVKGRFSATTQYDASVQGVKGVESFGLANTHTVRDETRVEKGFFFDKTQRYYETSTDTYVTQLHSKHGSIHIRSPKGDVDVRGAQMVSALAGHIGAYGDVDMGALLFRNTKSYSMRDWGGLSTASSYGTSGGARTAALMAGDPGVESVGGTQTNVSATSHTGMLRANGADFYGDEVSLYGYQGVSLEGLVLQNTYAQESSSLFFGSGAGLPDFDSVLKGMKEDADKGSYMGIAKGVAKFTSNLQSTSRAAKGVAQGLLQGDVLAAVSAANLTRFTLGFQSSRDSASWSDMKASNVAGKRVSIGSREALKMRGSNQSASESLSYSAKEAEMGSMEGTSRQSSQRSSVGFTFDAKSRDVTGFSASTSQSSATKGLEHRVHISAPVINFITPAYKPEYLARFKAAVHGSSSVEGKFAASGGLEFSRKDMALESTSNSSSLGFSLSGGSLMSGGIGSATVSASYHDSSEVKSALKGFDEASERANVESAGGSYDISRVKEEKHSSGFDFSVDAIGLAGMMGGGGNSSTFSVPLEIAVEKDGDKSTFFMTSGNLQDAVLETADNFVSAAKDMSAFGQSFMQNPGDTTAKLLNPLKGLVDEIGDRAFGKQPSKPAFVPTIDSDGEEYEDIVIEEFEKPAVKSAAKASAKRELTQEEQDAAKMLALSQILTEQGVDADLVSDLMGSMTQGDFELKYQGTLDHQRGRDKIAQEKTKRGRSISPSSKERIMKEALDPQNRMSVRPETQMSITALMSAIGGRVAVFAGNASMLEATLGGVGSIAGATGAAIGVGLVGLDVLGSSAEVALIKTAWATGNLGLLPEYMTVDSNAWKMMEQQVGYPFGRPDLSVAKSAAYNGKGPHILWTPKPDARSRDCEGVGTQGLNTGPKVLSTPMHESQSANILPGGQRVDIPNLPGFEQIPDEMKGVSVLNQIRQDYVPAPKGGLLAFPEAKPAPRKTFMADGKKRARWKDADHIYEWDSQHGKVEVYNKSGRQHLGEFDPYTGVQTKPADATRSVEK